MDSSPEWLFSPFRLNIANGYLQRNGETIALRPKTFALLCYLVEHHGQLIQKPQLLDAVWGHSHVTESVLEGCISELRRALGDHAKAPRFLETVPKRGYRFIAEVNTDTFQTPPPVELSGESLYPVRVGRDAFLEKLQSLWSQTQSGERRLVFLIGEAGVGKTTLIEMFLQSIASQKPAVLWGQCIEHFGAGEAFLPLLSALQQAGTDFLTLLRSCAPTWLVQMPALLEAAQRGVLQQEVLGATRERMLREGCELLEAASANSPLIVVLEDLHWSDYATLDLFAATGRRRGKSALLMIGSFRPGDVARPDHPLRLMHHELRMHRLCTELRLDGFSTQELTAYLTRRFPESQFPEVIASMLHRRTAGHPLFLANLLDDWLAEGKIAQTGPLWSVAGNPDLLEHGVPNDLRQMIEHRLARLDADDQRLLGVLSVAGIEASAALVAAILDQDPVMVEERCENLIRRGPLLEAAGVAEWPDGTVAGNYAFRHALYAEVLYQGLSVAYRISLHRRLGERLEIAYAEQVATIAPELARHFEESREYVKAIRYLETAAHQAANRFANQEALGYLDRALGLVARLPEAEQITQRFPLLQWSAAVRCSMYHMEEAVAVLLNLLELARAVSNKIWEVKVLVDLGRMYVLIHPKRCLEWVDEALEKSLDLPDEKEKVLVKGIHAHWHLTFDEWQDEYQQSCSEALSVAYSTSEPRIFIRHLIAYIVCEIFRSNYRAACVSAEEGIQYAKQAADGYLFMAVQTAQGLALLMSGEWQNLTELIATGLDAAKKNENPMQTRRFLILNGVLHLEAGDYDGSLRHCESAAATTVVGDSIITNFYHVYLAKAFLHQGKLSSALEHLQEIDRLRTDEDRPLDGFARLWHPWAYIEYALAVGDLRLAFEKSMQLLAVAMKRQERTFISITKQLLARIALQRADLEEAQVLIDEALAGIAKGDVALASWRVYECAAEIATQRGDANAAQQYSRQCNLELSHLADALSESNPLRNMIRANTSFLNQSELASGDRGGYQDTGQN